MQTKTNKVDGVGWTIHGETGLDVLNKRKIWAKVINTEWTDDHPEFVLWSQFIEIFAQSTDVTVPFEWPAIGTTDKVVLLKARDAWFALSGNVYRQWTDDREEVDSPPVDKDLLPPSRLSEKKDVIPSSPPNDLNSASPLITTSRVRKSRKQSLSSPNP